MRKGVYSRCVKGTRGLGLLGVAATLFLPQLAMAQTGVDDDRVSLPAGPGSIDGVGDNVEIDPNMGAMNYNVDVTIPQGINGHTPSIGLNYSSASGSSVLGVGWSMPMMTIERMTSRGAPSYIKDDLFAANGGAELVEVARDGDTQTYRERFEKSFVRYTWHQVGEGEEGYWTAERPDGSVAYYGADAAGNLVTSARAARDEGGTYKYFLVAEVDPYGHEILYDYVMLDGTHPLLDSIEYAESDTGMLYQIKLGYESRQDLINDASGGFELITANRVSSVQVLSRAQIIREYVLTYEDQDDAGGFSRLMRVEKYGKGGLASGTRYPTVFGFGYSNALGVTCQGADCDSPYLVNMGMVQGASGLAAGTATLVDINADGLPDILDTTEAGAHKIIINRLTPNGDTFDHGFEPAVASAVGTGASFGLGNEITQVLDVNGDGLSDLVNASSGATLIAGYGLSDWQGAGTPLDTEVLRNINISEAKFLDYNNDKRVDLITSTGDTTIVYENMGGSFQARTTESLGVPFANAETIELADMNGDGFNDLVEVQASGSIRYRLNYGWGKWSEWKNTTGVAIELSERELVDLEDLNGDGISDVVVVTATQVKYAINRNGDRFDPFVTISSSDIAGELPERQMGDKVLYADMNANGSEDVVWFDTQGQVQYLELFPVRPNLLSRIDNGIGFIQKIGYTTAAQEEAKARAAGTPWSASLSMPMNMVASTDLFVTLTGGEDGTGLHELVEYDYRDGFYDGVEKQFRGFEVVDVEVMESDSQEGGVTTMYYDVGREFPQLNGLMVGQIVRSGGEVLREESKTYELCDVDGVPSPDALEAQGKKAIYFPCETSMENIIKERRPESEWVKLASEYTYDGFGNVTYAVDHGVVAEQGDEQFVETVYYEPGDGKWFVGMPLIERTWNIEGGSTKNETKYYYDGQDFIGSQDEITHGFISRQTVLAGDGEIIEAFRLKRDEHGNSVEAIAPNGSIEETDRLRRRYVYDDFGLFVNYVDVLVEEGHVLRRSQQYEYDFQNTTDVTDWVLILNGEEASPRNERHYQYDDFGRMVKAYEPGDKDETPSREWSYDLGEPFSVIEMRKRTERNGAIDEVTVQCHDGRGKLYQTRNTIEPGRYIVSGFTVYNARGAVVDDYYSYESDSADCEDAVPTDVPKSTYRFDAEFRPLEQTFPGEEIYGKPPRVQVDYLPLATAIYDPNDLDEESPHYLTPTIQRMDGLDRLISIERMLGQDEVAEYRLHYDETGSFTGYTDPAGNRHELVVDLAGRITAVRDETTGESTYTYDEAGNVISETDARGATTRYAYDGANRLIERWDEEDRDGSLIQFSYDMLPEGCDLTECTNLANRLAAARYETTFGPTMDRFGYDSRQRAVFSGRSFGGVADLWVRNSYDNLDRVTSMTYSDGTEIAREYDSLDRVKAIPGFLDAIGYSENQTLESILYNNGAKTMMEHDVLRRVVSKRHTDGTGQVFDALEFERDIAGQLLAVNEERDGLDVPTHAAKFTLDAWYRVTESTRDRGAGAEETLTYSYDMLDRVQKVISSLEEASTAHMSEVTYSNERPLAATRAGVMEVSYDLAGLLEHRGGMDFARDHLGRLRIAAKGEQREVHDYGTGRDRVSILGDDRSVFYGPAGLELRDGVSRIYITLGGEKVAMHQEAGVGVGVYGDEDGDGVLTSADAFVAGEENAHFSQRQILGGVAARMLAERRDKKTFFHTDHLRSLIAATDEGGEVLGRQGFYGFGQHRFQDGFVDDVYGFTGLEHNVFTGLIQFQMRDLDPKLGRWASFDPLFAKIAVDQMMQLGESTTGYAYIGNGFADSFDPLGLKDKNGGDDKKKKKKKKRKKKKKKAKKKKSKKNKDKKRPKDAKAEGGRQQQVAAAKDSAAAPQAPEPPEPKPGDPVSNSVEDTLGSWVEGGSERVFADLGGVQMPKDPSSSLAGASKEIGMARHEEKQKMLHRQEKMKEWGKVGLTAAVVFASVGLFVLEAETGVISDGAQWVGNQF